MDIFRSLALQAPKKNCLEGLLEALGELLNDFSAKRKYLEPLLGGLKAIPRPFKQNREC